MGILRNVRALSRRKLLVLIILVAWGLLSQIVRLGDVDQDRFAGNCAFLVILMAAGGYLEGTVRMMRTILKLGSAAWIIVAACDLISQAAMWNGIHPARLAVDCALPLLLLLFGVFPSVSEVRKHLLQFSPFAISAVTIFALICWYAPNLFEPLGSTWIDVLPIMAWAYLFAHLADACRIPKPALGLILLIVDACITWPSDVVSFLVLIVMGSVVALWLNGQRESRRPLKLNEPSAVNQH